MPVGAIHRDPESTAFFDGTARGELLLRRCTTCGHLSEPATATCPTCTERNLGWIPASRRGSVVSWTVVHGKGPHGPTRTPIALVELDEGSWLEMQMIDIDPDAITAGLRVRIEFEQPDGGEALPVAAPAAD